MKPKLNPAAKALGTPVFRKRVVADKTKYSRKGRADKGAALDRFWSVANASNLSISSSDVL